MRTCKTILSITIALVLIFITSIRSFSQSDFTPAKQHEHIKAVYEDKTNNKLYWPKNLPVFIRLAPSPDAKSPSFLLENIDRTGNGKYETDKDGIELEINGNQFVRWVNAVTNNEIKYKFYSDGEPPVISHKFNNATKYTKEKTVYFGKGLNCEFTAKDRLSGTKDLYISVDGKDYVSGKSIFDFNTEKSVFVQYYAVDNVGFFNKPKTTEFTVDLTAPVTTHRVETNFIDDVLSASSTISLVSNDELSGVKKIYYKLDNQSKFSVYTGRINIAKSSNGEHKITYYAVDHVNNEEKTKVYSFYLDKQEPEVDISITASQYTRGKETYVSAFSLVTFKASDDKSKVNKVFYSINNAKRYTSYENPFPLSLKSGPFTVIYYSTDRLGNTSKRTSKRYQMDLIPPVTSYEIEGASYVQRSTIWLTKDTKLKLSSKDGAAGVKNIQYVLGNNAPQPYENAIQVKEEGNFLCRFWGTDNVGNREGDYVLLLIVDNSAPEIQEIFSVSPVETKTNDKGEKVAVYPQYTSLFLAATDMSSGLKDVMYKMNNKAEVKYTTAMLLDKPGEYSIDIRAIDNLGHESKKSVKFEIRKLSADDYK